MDFSFIPNPLETHVFFGLIILSCFTSMLTASLGIGGGTILLAVMAQWVPVKAVIPVHGVIQLGSNGGRAVLLRKYIDKKLVIWFFIGSLLGALIGGGVVAKLPANTLKVILGAFILYTTWGPKLKYGIEKTKGLAIGGFISTLLTMFVGATGPFVLAFFRAFKLAPTSLVATSAACLFLQHSLKALTFSLLGFAFFEYLTLIVFMVASGFVGTWVGSKILLKIEASQFKKALNFVLTLLAIRLLLSGSGLL